MAILPKISKTEEEKRLKEKENFELYLDTLKDTNGILNREVVIKPALLKKGLTIEELGDRLIEFKDSELLLMFVDIIKARNPDYIRYAGTNKIVDLDEISKVIAENGKSYHILSMSRIVGANVNVLSKGIMRVGNAFDVYEFAKLNPSSDKEALLIDIIYKYEMLINETKNPFAQVWDYALPDLLFAYAKDVPGANITKICKIIASDYPAWSYKVAKELSNADMEELSKGMQNHSSWAFTEVYEFAQLPGANIPLKEMLAKSYYDKKIVDLIDRGVDAKLFSELIVLPKERSPFGASQEQIKEIFYKVANMFGADMSVLCAGIMDNPQLNFKENFIYSFAKDFQDKLSEEDIKLLSKGVNKPELCLKFAQEVKGADVRKLVEKVCTQEVHANTSQLRLKDRYGYISQMPKVKAEYVYNFLPSMIEQERRNVIENEKLGAPSGFGGAPDDKVNFHCDRDFVYDVLAFTKLPECEAKIVYDAVKGALSDREFKDFMRVCEREYPRDYKGIVEEYKNAGQDLPAMLDKMDASPAELPAKEQDNKTQVKE